MGEEPLRPSDLIEGLSIVHLKLYGLWYHMNAYRTTGKIGLVFKIQALSLIFVLFPYVLFQTIYILREGVDLQKLALVYLVIAPSISIPCKVLFFWKNFGQMCKIFDGLRKDFLKGVPKWKHPRTQDIYRKVSKKCNRLVLASFVATIVSAVSDVSIPVYKIMGSTRKKVLSGWYPFPYAESPWYEIVYVYESLGLACFGGSSFTMYQSVILMPMISICSHFDVFCYHIATLKKERKLNDVDGNSSLNDELKRILMDYERLTRYGDFLKEVYSGIISILLGTGIINMTALVLRLLFVKDETVLMIKTAIFGFFQAIELCLICLCSSMMETSSSNIHEALYSNDWYLADKNFARTQQMMMIRASRPLKLTAMKMYPVNMETMLNIFQFIYTTAAVLSKMKSEPNK